MIIVRRTYLDTYPNDPEGDSLLYDLHFWIGSQSTQDEYCIALYKTVELDTFLDDKPIQYREVEGYESELFLSYFQTITIMKGGGDCGYRHVEPTKYKARLLHIKADGKGVVIKEVNLDRRNLNSGDVFVLDLGLQIYQWNGSKCDKSEKYEAGQYILYLKSERHGKPEIESLEEGDANHTFYENVLVGGEEDDDDDENDSGSFAQTLFRLSIESGEFSFNQEGENEFMRSQLDSNDVFIIDTGKELFVWIGSNASHEEKQNSMGYAHKYLQGTKHPFVPVICVKEGQETNKLKAVLN